MNAQTDQLPEEWHEKLKQDATGYADLQIGERSKLAVPALVEQWETTKDDFKAGASAYVLRAYRAERENAELKTILRYVRGCVEQGLVGEDLVNFINDKLKALQGEKDGKI